jgi:hypothetical protein
VPYDFKGKLEAKEYVKRVRNATFCKECNSQPVEFHCTWHIIDGNARVPRMAARGCSIQAIKLEISKCEALCKSCHMKKDGRTKALEQSHPFRKGMTYTEPIPCISCGFPAKPTRKGMCRECYDKQRRKR